MKRVVAKILIVMPAYNEVENLPIMVNEIFSVRPDVHILVVDDSSPDGTGDVACQMAAQDSQSRIHVLIRAEKNGLGPAYLAGFAWALDHSYDIVCEMDMDGSHRSVDLPRVIDAVAVNPAVDAAIGSRRVRGGYCENWPWYRNMISLAGSTYARLMLGLSTHDVTAGFRAYRASILKRMNLGNVRANGYVFQIDMTRRLEGLGARVVEVPVVFVERVYGVSKMDSSIVLEAMARVTVWGIERFSRGFDRMVETLRGSHK